MLNNNNEKYVECKKKLIAFEFTNGLAANETEMNNCRKNLRKGNVRVFRMKFRFYAV